MPHLQHEQGQSASSQIDEVKIWNAAEGSLLTKELESSTHFNSHHQGGVWLAPNVFNELQGHWLRTTVSTRARNSGSDGVAPTKAWSPRLFNIHVDGMSLPPHADSELFIFSWSSAVELQDYSVLRALVRFYIIRFYFSVLFYIFGESQRRLFEEVIPLKLLWNNLTWHVPIQGCTKGSRNTIQ